MKIDPSSSYTINNSKSNSSIQIPGPSKESTLNDSDMQIQQHPIKSVMINSSVADPVPLSKDISDGVVEAQNTVNRIIKTTIQTNSKLVNPFGSFRKTPLPKLVQPLRKTPEDNKTDIETDEETNYRNVIEVIGTPSL